MIEMIDMCMIDVLNSRDDHVILQDKVGTIEVGKAADLAVWSCRHPRELAYHMGHNPLQACFVDGNERDLSLKK